MSEYLMLEDPQLTTRTFTAYLPFLRRVARGRVPRLRRSATVPLFDAEHGCKQRSRGTQRR
jgi:hypothetical protein